MWAEDRVSQFDGSDHPELVAQAQRQRSMCIGIGTCVYLDSTYGFHLGFGEVRSWNGLPGLQIFAKVPAGRIA